MSSSSHRPEELGARLEFLERRLTLLERSLARLNAPAATDPPARFAEGVTHFPCDAAELRIANAFSLEYDEAGERFRWVGGETPLQFVVPNAPAAPGVWRLHFRPHHFVDLARMRLLVNDRLSEFVVVPGERDKQTVECPAPGGRGGATAFVLEGLAPVRPSEVDGTNDPRLLALRFYGLEHRALERAGRGAPS